MSVREEERNKNCPSRGLGLAAAAIGVGVGAALYYFFSKRPENPADEGSTSGWEEEAHVLHECTNDSSYTTISEHSTTDTSIHDSPVHKTSIARRLWNSDSESSSSDSEFNTSGSSATSSECSDDTSNVSSDLESNTEWDVTNSSLDVPVAERTPVMMEFGELTVRLLNPHSGWKSPWKIFPKYFRSAEVEMSKRREQAFRERAWTLEECSICFEGMQKNQEVFSLACTHRFHQACILPWLEQQQTCPNCRKAS